MIDNRLEDVLPLAAHYLASFSEEAGIQPVGFAADARPVEWLLQNAPVDERLAASGVLVVAIDVRLASEAPYPASVADVNYGIRWLKSKAQAWRGSPVQWVRRGRSARCR